MFDKLNLADTILKNAKFSILAKAITDSGLADTLKTEGPFTVLAPTDEAFTRFSPETMTALRKPENKERLAKLLKYHVIKGKIMSADIARLTTAKTVLGQEIKIDVADGIKINNAKLEERNIEATNGVIHAIDTVLVLRVIAALNTE